MFKRIDKKYSELNGIYNHYGRDDFYYNFLEQLTNHSGNLSIALSGSWGSGKTFIVNSLCNDISKLETTESIYFNVWENEFFETPLYGLLNTLLKNQEFDTVFKNSVMSDSDYSVNASFSLNYLALSLGLSLHKENKMEDLLKDISFSNVSIELLSNLLDNYLINKSRLILFVDELDRCKPNYSIKVLEQFNHLYNDKLTIVYSIDSEQLHASIRHVYGSDYNAKIFLYKFFDDVIKLPVLDHDNVYKYIVNLNKDITKLEFLTDVVYHSIVYFDINFREINRFMKYLSMIKKLQHTRTSHVSSRIYNSVLIILCLIRVKDTTLLPKVIMDYKEFQKFGLILNSFEMLSEAVANEHNNNPAFTDNLEHIVRTILDEPEIRKMLY